MQRKSSCPTLRAGIALLLGLGALAASAGTYGLKQTEPDTGTGIRRVVGSTSIPLDRGYADLNASELADLRAQFASLSASDEPPFPADGLRSLRELLSRLQHKLYFRVRLSLLVRVGPDGIARNVQVLESTDDDVRNVVALALMDARYKPAKCGGSACEMHMPFALDLSSARNR